jgi:AcrR family transcriptional regulator
MSSPRPPGRPRDPAVDDAILSAALRLLGKQGYGRMSVEAVAAAAGVSKSTVYRRFATKADLATAAIASMIDAGAVPPDDLSVEAALTWTLEHLAQRLRDPHSMALVGTLLVEEEQTPDLIALFRERVWALRAGHLRDVLERACARGEVRSTVDLEAAVGMLIGSLYSAHIGQGGIPRDWPARVVRTALDSLRST